jgi:hypothetical protein
MECPGQSGKRREPGTFFAMQHATQRELSNSNFKQRIYVLIVADMRSTSINFTWRVFFNILRVWGVIQGELIEGGVYRTGSGDTDKCNLLINTQKMIFDRSIWERNTPLMIKRKSYNSSPLVYFFIDNLIQVAIKG